MREARRYPGSIRLRVGRNLRRMGGLRHGERKRFAELMDVTPKSLKNWEKAAPGGEIPLGRRPHTPEAHRGALKPVLRELKRQQWPGWREVDQALPEIPTRLVQRCVTLWKARRRKQAAAHRKTYRSSVRVLARNAVLAQDGTHLGRIAGKPVEAQVVKDPATLKTVQIAVGAPATSQDVLEHLQELERTRSLPLVWQTDNGSIYCAEEVQAYLRAKRVVHLRNLPHTPQHNAAMERQIGELKRASGLGKGTLLVSVEAAAGRLKGASSALDARRLRASRGWKTACELDDGLVPGYNVDRTRFYEAVQERIRQAVKGACSARQARLLEREAVYAVLESFGLVSRHRGGRPVHASKRKIFREHHIGPLQEGDTRRDETSCCKDDKPKSLDDAGRACCDEDKRTVQLRVETGTIGHVFLQTPSRTVGFYPTDKASAFVGGLYGDPVAGETRDDSLHPYDPKLTRSYRVCPETLKKLEASIDAHAGDFYSGLNNVTRNCAGWGCGRLSDAGITPPLPPNTKNFKPNKLK